MFEKVGLGGMYVGVLGVFCMINCGALGRPGWGAADRAGRDTAAATAVAAAVCC